MIILVSVRRFLALLLILPSAMIRGAIPVSDFKLLDTNTNSPRSGQIVSPRDYLFQISAYYFAEAGCGYCQTQFGLLNDMQRELRSSNADFNIEILGVNDYTQSRYNAQMTAGRVLPWLQDTASDLIWDRWGVTFRDVRILNPQNELVGTFNLTEHSLLISSNRVTLKTMLLNAAKAIDTDTDHLPDSWEIGFFGNLDNGPNDDSDHDGYDNFTELAFRTDPADPESHPIIVQTFNANDQFEITYKRWPGSMIDYVIEGSTNLTLWLKFGEFSSISTPLNLYDGTASSQVTITLAPSKDERTVSFVRLKALPRQ